MDLHFDWNRARAFLATADAGSFSGAARALGSTQPTVGRQVAALESELGVALFERVGRGLQLTATGLELVEHVRSMSEAAMRVSLTATGQALAIEGTVSISASEAIAAHLLPPIIGALRRARPRIEIELVVSNDPSDLHRREADIAIRNFRPKSQDLIARKIRDAQAHLYASHAYLERVGPIAAADLRGAELFAFDRSPLMIDGFAAIGLEVTRSQFPIVTSNHLVQWALCKAGVGICAMMEEIGEAEPCVRRVLPSMAPLPVPIWLVCHREVKTSRRIRLVFDRLAEGLAQPA